MMSSTITVWGLLASAVFLALVRWLHPATVYFWVYAWVLALFAIVAIYTLRHE